MAADIHDDGSGKGHTSAIATSHEDPMEDDTHEGEKFVNQSILRAEFTINRNNQGRFHAIPLVRSLVEAIIKTKHDITFKTQDGSGSFNNLEAFPATEASIKQFFSMASISSTSQAPQKVLIKICVESPTVIDFYKKQDGRFAKYCKDNGIWISDHPYETLEITKIGWVIQKSTTTSHRTTVEDFLIKRIQQHEETMREPGSTAPAEIIPPFKVHSRNVKGSKLEGSRIPRSAHAFEIECELINSVSLRARLMQSQPDDAREGLFIEHSLRQTDKKLHDALIDSHNVFLDNLRKIEILGITRDGMDNANAATEVSLRQHLMKLGEKDKEGFSILSIEPTRATEEKGKWIIVCMKSSEDRVIKSVKETFSHIRETDPVTFPNPCLGGKLNDTYEAYTTALRNATLGTSTSTENGGLNRSRSNGNRNRTPNKRQSVTITYDEEEFPAIIAPVTPPLIPTTRTPLSTVQRRNAPAVTLSKKDTYASRAAATSSSKRSTTTTNKTNNNASDEPRSDENSTPKQHSREVSEDVSTRMAALDDRMAKLENANDTLLKRIESQLIAQQGVNNRIETNTAKEIKTLRVKIETLSEQLAEFMSFVRQESNVVVDNTAKTLHSKRGPESSPSPNGPTKHPPKRISRPAPIQLETEFGSDEEDDAINEEEGDSSNMEDMEQSYTQSRSSSPSYENAKSREGSEAGEMNTQPGSQES
jgi:hypothetical protein